MGMIYPYTHVFLKQLGFSALQIGLAVGAKQLVGGIASVALGFVADRFQYVM